MKKPIIVLTGGMEMYEGGIFSGNYRVHVVANYTEAIIRAGGVPIVAPPSNDFNNLSYLANIIAMADGLLLTGGNDIDPALYDEEPHPKLDELMIQKDKMEYVLLEKAFAKNIAILGICRGHQMLNVYLGGTLYQDLSQNPNINIMHQYKTDLAFPSHTVNTVKNSRLNKLIGDKYRVNSAHHQVIKDLSPDLLATAYSEDGVIEGVEHKYRDNVFAVQWHPEMMSHNDDKMQAIFNEFVEISRLR